jgi:hypothetical protein
VRKKGRESVNTNREKKGNSTSGKVALDIEDILKRVDAIERAVESLDERLSKLEARFIPYPGHVAGPGKKRP